MRRRIGVIAAVLAITAALGLAARWEIWHQERSYSPFDFDALTIDETSEEAVAAHHAWVLSYGEEQRAEYLQNYSLPAIAQEFPIRAGMTVAEMDAAIAENLKQFDASEFEQQQDMYNFGHEKRTLNQGSGLVYYWVNFKYLLHCDVVIESGKIESIWVMPGNAEWTTGIYYRISGSGAHKIPAEVR